MKTTTKIHPPQDAPPKIRPAKIHPHSPERKALRIGAVATALLLGMPLTAPSAAPNADAADTADVPPATKNLYEANCTTCHGSEVYTREDRMIDSLSGLESQVRRCESSLELRWFDDQIMDVTQLLNDRYYHFKP